MQVVSVDAMSANGKITKGEDANAHTWTSPEDWVHFRTLRDSFDLLVMGSGAYRSVRPAPEPGRLRIVLTHTPAAYAHLTVPGQLEFITANCKDLISMLEKRGFTRMMLVGGQVNTQFWAAGLVNEAYITVEPKLFGQGRLLADDVDFAADLALQSIKQLNKQGTLLLHYFVDNG